MRHRPQKAAAIVKNNTENPTTSAILLYKEFLQWRAGAGATVCKFEIICCRTEGYFDMAAPVDLTEILAGGQEARKRNLAIANALSWGEILWIAKKKPIEGNLAALHDRAFLDESRLPFFLLPSLPQLSTDYLALAEMMDPRQPLFTVYLPTARRAPANGLSVHGLAQYYADVIEKSWPCGPVALGGWSVGAPISRAVAALLSRRGRNVPLIAVIDGPIPAAAIAPLSLAERMRLAGYRLSSCSTKLARLGRDAIRHARQRPANESLAHAFGSAWQNSDFRQIWEKLDTAMKSRMGIARPGMGALHPAEIVSNLAIFPPEHRAMAIELYDMVEAYQPEKNYPGEVLVFEASEEPNRTSTRVAATWRSIAGNVKVISVNASHMSIIRSPDGLVLARDLCERLRGRITPEAAPAFEPVPVPVAERLVEDTGPIPA
jgi:thioesterase domain-containing protein